MLSVLYELLHTYVLYLNMNENGKRDMLKPVIVSAAFVLWITTEEPTYEWDEENTNDHAEK